jgi:hypothetical protein
VDIGWANAKEGRGKKSCIPVGFWRLGISETVEVCNVFDGLG